MRRVRSGDPLPLARAQANYADDNGGGVTRARADRRLSSSIRISIVSNRGLGTNWRDARTSVLDHQLGNSYAALLSVERLNTPFRLGVRATGTQRPDADPSRTPLGVGIGLRILYANHTGQISGAEQSCSPCLLGCLGVSPAVACPEGPLAESIRELGVPVVTIPGTDAVSDSTRGIRHVGWSTSSE